MIHGYRLLWNIFGRNIFLPKKCEVLHRGALFYEDNGEIAHAMEIYYRSGDLEKLSLLLMQSANDPSEVAYDYRTIPYYRALPKESLLSSPELMASKSMILLSIGRFGGKRILVLRVGRIRFSSKQGESNVSNWPRLAQLLRIALPHRGSKHLASILKDVSCSILDGHCALPEFPLLVISEFDQWQGKIYVDGFHWLSKYYHFEGTH